MNIELIKRSYGHRRGRSPPKIDQMEDKNVEQTSKQVLPSDYVELPKLYNYEEELFANKRIRSQSANLGAVRRYGEPLDPEVSKIIKELRATPVEPTVLDRETDTQDLDQYMSQDIPTVPLPTGWNPINYDDDHSYYERSNDASFRTARENSIKHPTKELNSYIDLVKQYPEFKDQIMNNLIS